MVNSHFNHSPIHNSAIGYSRMVNKERFREQYIDIPNVI